MFTVIGFMAGGVIAGFFLRKRNLSWVQRMITFLIWTLLFFLGIEAGSNRNVIDGLGTLGLEAVVMTMAFVIGSCVSAWALWCLLYRRKGGKA
ncbi:MAG: lysine exporter LysO family protein [Clostridium sp.]|nr:lysine exporter LysO family protein [Bacteroides sp.]MCM1199111.1 lysine exporter LysO family protein [Clostridium sp.]